MKPDELEKFVTQNRDGFDDFEPDPAIFAQVQQNIKPARKFNPVKILWRAAAIIIIFVSSYFFHDYQSEKRQVNQLIEQADENQIKEARLFFEARAYYSSMIQNKEKEVFALTKNYPKIKKELKDEFKEIDKEIKSLQNDLKDGVSNQEIIEAMIQNYRIKLEILENVWHELSTEVKEEKTQSNEI